MLSAATIEYTTVEAQSYLHAVFNELDRTAFDTSLLSAEIKPAFDTALDLAYQYAHGYCRQAGKPETIGAIAIDYYADSVFNACASSKGNHHAIAVSTGVPFLLLVLFFDVFKSTNPFSIDYQDPIYESPEPGDYYFPKRLQHGERPDSSELAALIESTVRDSIPDHRWQRVWSITMAELATFFVFAHEIGHLIRGHTALLGKTRHSSLVEVGSPGLKRLRPLLQAWETEADEIAFAMLWSYVMGTKKNRTRLMNRFRCAKTPNPPLTLIARSIYAVSFVFFLLGQSEIDVDAGGSHPSGMMRVTYVIAFAESALEKLHVGIPPELIHDEVTKAHSQAEAAWNRMGLSFGVERYAATMDELTETAARMERRRERSDRLLKDYKWPKLRSAFESPVTS